MGFIYIHDLKVSTMIGVHPNERTQKQEINIHMIIEYDSQKAQETDDLKDALDYEVLVDKTVRLVQKSQCFLIERLAHKMIRGTMKNKRIKSVVVRVEKPGAVKYARAVSYESMQSR